jgi:sigma-B regulation protein RsbU (phosphoserine phosphatase)
MSKSSHHIKRFILITGTSFLLLAIIAIMAWRVRAWNEHGWSGLAFVRAAPPAALDRIVLPFFGAGHAYVVFVFPESPADIAGLRRQDEMLAIDNVSVLAAQQLDSLAAAVQVGDTLEYQIIRGGSAQRIPIILSSPLRTASILVGMIASLVVALAYIAIGGFVYWKRPGDRRALICYLLFVVAAGHFLIDAFLQADWMNAIGVIRTFHFFALPLGFLLAFTLFALFFPLLLHLALVFPHDHLILRTRPSLLRWIYALSLILAVLIFLLFKLYPPPPRSTFQAGWPGSLAALSGVQVSAFVGFLLLGLFYLVASCFILVRSYRESGLEEKRQVQWPLWGTIVAVSARAVLAFLSVGAFVFLGFEAVVSSSTMLILHEILRKACYVLIPVSFAFAIMKRRLMDIEPIIKKTIVYSLITGIVLAGYFLLVAGLGGWLMKYLAAQNIWFIVFATLALATLFIPVRNRVQSFVDRRFFRQKQNYPQTLRKLSRVMAETNELPLLLELVAEQLQQAMQNRNVVIFAKGLRDQAFHAAAKVGVPDEVLHQLKIEASSQLFHLKNESTFQNLPEAGKLALCEIDCSRLAPVRHKTGLLGFASIGHKLSGEDYDLEDCEFLTAVCEQLATGMNDFRLREQVKEFEQAREIQQGLMPKVIPQIPGFQIAGAWHPARTISGDYFDVLKFSESKIAVCIADVVGKGMSAALMMSNLQAAVRAFATEHVPPQELCQKVNHFMRGNLAAGKFITFFYGILDAEKKNFIHTRAGHNAPMLVRGNGSIRLLEAGGAAFGLFSDYPYQQQEVALTSGDRILLFTDGVTEAMNTNGDEFGEERLAELLATHRRLDAAALQERVINNVTSFCHGEHQDDVALVVVGVE